MDVCMSEISNRSDQNNDTYDTVTSQSCLLADYGCIQDSTLASTQEHITTEQHQKVLVTLAQKLIQQDTNDTQTETSISDTRTRFYKHNETIAALVQSMERLNDQLLQFSSSMLRLQTTLSPLSNAIDDTEANNKLQHSQMDMILLNQDALLSEATTVKERVRYDDRLTKYNILDGSMIWKIDNVSEKTYDAQSERQTSIYSPPFYTSQSGYRVCIRVYLNGDGNARGTHLSVFLVILRGEYDAVLEWPFSYRVSFCLFDQRTMINSNGAIQPKHIIDSFRPDTQSISFRWPSLSMNIASGIPKFMLLLDLYQPSETNPYIVNDTMFIKMFIDFIGIPKYMVAFIFNLNVALPKKMQQKLIDEEYKRRQEQEKGK